MQIAMIGRQRLGASTIRWLMRSEHPVVAYDRDRDAPQMRAREGATPAHSLDEVGNPRAVWVMNITDGDPISCADTSVAFRFVDSTAHGQVKPALDSFALHLPLRSALGGHAVKSA
jgi:6-phosphogluconate dehydrogenase (decarboxylating)